MKSYSVKINKRSYVFQKKMTILDAALETQTYPQEYRKVDLPTLFYRKGIVDIDVSGVCTVEADGELVNASITRIKDGMEIFTSTPAVVAARKEALSKILCKHNKDCKYCFRNKECELQTLLHMYGFTDEQELAEKDFEELDLSSKVLVRDNNKCIRCKRCINVCAKLQAVSAIAATDDDGEVTIAPSSPLGLAAASCVNCGQCVAVCPTGALVEKRDSFQVQMALDDPSKYVVAQVAPAVRTALGEKFEFRPGCDVTGRIAGALKELGFDKVFDTKYGADLTIMEEAEELIDRIQNDGVLPMITSCCPGWIKYAEHFYPEMLPHISTCKSPHMMEGAVIKSYFAEKEGIDPSNIVVVSIMPCTAKKFEINREEFNHDVDFVITTNEIAAMILDADIQFEAMYPDEKFDDPMGEGTGAAEIFGKSGGVLEAAVRTASDKIDTSNLRTIAVSGLAKANALLQQIKNKEVEYDFIEIMACEGGCINGGGQPHHDSISFITKDVLNERANVLTKNDELSDKKKSNENSSVKKIYDEYLGEPGSHKAHEILHTSYHSR